MRKITYVALLTLGLIATSCGSSSSHAVEDYYSIDTSYIPGECLVNQDVLLDVRFTNLGEVETPKYEVIVTFDEEEVTEAVYNATSKLFNSGNRGTYDIRFTVLNSQGQKLVTTSGASFTKKISLEVLVQSFAPINAEGEDVTINDEASPATISFGDSYLRDTKLDSGQYRLTGMSFVGSYYVTYKLEDVQYSPQYTDPALYFGWTRNDTNGYDDSLKLSTGAGTMAAWIWGESGLADLAVNRNHGWFYNVWYNAPKSVSNNTNISGDHHITFARYIDEANKIAKYGIIYDDEAFTFLDIGGHYTDVLRNVWVESVNTKLILSLVDFGVPEALESPSMVLNYQTGTVNEDISLLDGVSIAETNIYSSVIVPSFTVADPTGNDVLVENKTFTPAVEGEYTVTATLTDPANNTVTETAKINVEPVVIKEININLTKTSSFARVGSGIILYPEVFDDETEVEYSSLAFMFGTTYEEAVDVTANVLSVHEATTVGDMKFDVFTPVEAGNYWFVVNYEDTVAYKKIAADTNTASIYGWTYFDANFTGVIVGNNEIIYTNPNGGYKTGKLGKNIDRVTNWEISYDVTDLRYRAQGKLGITEAATKADGTFGGWEDLTIGGNVNNDLWGYETSTVGTGWQTYQWRSNWQNKTTEFMPDPSDNTKGCGRGAPAYTQYATGTHSYKITASTGAEGNVTYTYYIDGELEAVHHLPAAHNNINSFDFFQFWAESMNGIVTNIQVK